MDAVSQDRRDDEMQRCQRCRDNVRVEVMEKEGSSQEPDPRHWGLGGY